MRLSITHSDPHKKSRKRTSNVLVVRSEGDQEKYQQVPPAKGTIARAELPTVIGEDCM